MLIPLLGTVMVLLLFLMILLEAKLSGETPVAGAGVRKSRSVVSRPPSLLLYNSSSERIDFVLPLNAKKRSRVPGRAPTLPGELSGLR